MAKLRYTSLDGLINNGVNDFVMEDTELTACKNVWSYRLGKLEKVPGYSKASSSQVIDNNSVSFLHWYYSVSDSTHRLIAASDTGSNLTLEYIAPNATAPVTSWTTLTGISTTLDTYATSKLSMANYLGKVFVVGHKTGSTFVPNFTINAATFNASDTDISSMPRGKYIVRYRDLLYVLNAYEGSARHPSRAYFCDDPVNGAITWTNLTNFVEFGYDDGDEITGAADIYDRLIVFKSRSMWKYDESERKRIADVGCDSYRSIQTVGDRLYWFNRYGFWRWDGAQPELVSERAKWFIDAIDQTKLDEVVATIYGGHEYRAYIGTVTVDDITYTNAWFCWDTRREKAYIRCTHHVAKSASNFIIDGKRRAYFGDNDGYVYKFADKIDAVYSDDNNEIDSFFVTKRFDFGQPETVKSVNSITTFTKHAGLMKIAAEVDEKKVFDEGHTRTIQKEIDDIEISTAGQRCRFKFYEKSSSKSWEFEGLVADVSIKEEK